jgi:glycosyltransferase involved in cell wall biosynthesis
MPEVAGNAALFVDPFSSDSICQAMQQIVTDETLRKELILKGQIRREKFNWQKTADILWKSIEKTVDV